METKSIVGQFKKEGNYLQLARELSSAGFVREDVLVEDDTDEVFLLSLSLKNESRLHDAKQIFQQFDPFQIYEFPFVAENKNRIRDYVNAAAKAQIFSLPAGKKHGHSTDGMNSEVVVGKQ